MTIAEHYANVLPINNCAKTQGINMVEFMQVLNPEYTIASVTGRVKELDSLITKANEKGITEYFDGWYDVIRDEVGIRVLIMNPDMVDIVAERIKSDNRFFLDEERDYSKNKKPNGYRSKHLIGRQSIATQSGPKLVSTEFQLRTIFQHGFAEIEHGTRYKLKYDSVDKEVNRVIEQIAQICNITNYQFDKRYIVLADILNREKDKVELFNSILLTDNKELIKADLMTLLNGLQEVRNKNYNELADLGEQMDRVTSRIFAAKDERMLLARTLEEMNLELSPDKIVPEKQSANSNAESLETAKDRTALKVVENGIKSLGVKVPESTTT